MAEWYEEYVGVGSDDPPEPVRKPRQPRGGDDDNNQGGGGGGGTNKRRKQPAQKRKVRISNCDLRWNYGCQY